MLYSLTDDEQQQINVVLSINTPSGEEEGPTKSLAESGCGSWRTITNKILNTGRNNNNNNNSISTYNNGGKLQTATAIDEL